MVKKLASYIKEYKAPSIATPICMIFEVLFEILIPMLMASIVNDGINKGDMGHIYRTGALMVLFAVLVLAVSYVFLSALLIFNVEPDTFNSFFDALYWAIISLSTIGYGDIYAHTVAGRLISMLSALMGIAVVALPSGIITAGFVEELRTFGKNDASEG